MTSIPLAQPRPPPPAPLITGWSRQRSFNSLPTLATVRRPSIPATTSFYGTEEAQTLLDGDGRAAKRRKLDSQVSSPASGIVASPLGDGSGPSLSDRGAKYVGAGWVGAVSGRAPKPSSAETKSKNAPPLPRIPFATEAPSATAPGRVRTSCRYRTDVVVSNTPDSLECPSDAPLFESKKPADYFPWTGKHPEDVINENNVVKGYWDNPPKPTERESNTAKAPLYNAFKHRSGLESLSALFTLVLEKKGSHGALSSASSFRPPPRVTLTEAKRKAWIADLADAGVPLRRLSRTIPQGIRGLQLLEQCLINEVPVNRVLWFAKCVGANEIRSLKRKGVNASITAGAESKWLREWTISIEQFLETAIGQCGSKKWADSLRYCLHLCTRLYQENLCDRDHFLDWIVKNTANCSLELLAAWLPLVQVFQQDLSRFRKRARQTAGMLLARLRELFDLQATKNTLWERLRNMVRQLAYRRPACFLMPDIWSRLSDVLRSCLGETVEKEQRIFEYIQSRNEHLMGERRDDDNKTNVDKAVFEALDTASAPFDVNRLSQQLLALSTKTDGLVHLCLRWATSRFRGGRSRVYLVARLVRKWQRAGQQIGPALLAFFSYEHDPSTLDMDAYRHLFADLSRTSTFSSSHFLQALSIQGSDAKEFKPDIDQDCSVLLQDLCLGDDEYHLQHLRDHLLRRRRHEMVNHFLARDSYKAIIQQALQDAGSDANDHITSSLPLEELEQLDWSTKSRLARWLRAEAGVLSKSAVVEIHDKPPLPGGRPLTLAQFFVIRDVLETFADIPVLADVLQILSNTRQESILASMVDTIHCNAECLSAIGALEPLQKLLGHAYIALRSVQSCILLFATSLLDLCQHFPCQTTPIRALQQDLVRGDRGRALAACSPFSDGVAESLQQAGATFIDDFEAILQGEPNMNEQTMTSLFTVLSGRITKYDGDDDEPSLFTLCQFLARLRFFRTAQADSLIKTWLARFLSTAWSEHHMNIVLELLYTRCVNIELLLELSESAPANSKCREAIDSLAIGGTTYATQLKDEVQQAYVSRIAARRYAAQNPERALDLLLSQGALTSTRLDECASLLPIVVGDNARLASLSDFASKNVAFAIDQLLHQTMLGSDDFQRMLSRVDWLSFPFYRFRVARLSSDIPLDADAADVASSIVKGLHLNLEATSIDHEIVEALFDSMPIDIQDRVRAVVERQFFETLPKLFQVKAISQPLHATAEEKLRSRAAIDKVVSLGAARPGQISGDGNGILIEKLTIVAKVLGARNEVAMPNPSSAMSTSSPTSPAFQALQNSLPPPTWDNRYRENVLGVVEYLDMLLGMISMKASTFTVSTATTLAKALQNEQIKLIALLASIATQPLLAQLSQSTFDDTSRTRIQSTISFALDVAARLADDLPEEARILCTKILKDRMRDERIQWLVGSMNTTASFNGAAGHGLVMMHDSKGYMGDYKPKQWEMLESGGGKDSDTCLGLGLFGAKRL